jgi:hypothetical protein
MDAQTISLITIPIFSGVIGYVTNWSGVLMLFYPVHFKGWRLPGLAALAQLLPRKPVVWRLLLAYPKKGARDGPDRGATGRGAAD